MPMMRTKAPSGSRRTPYSVSPRWKLHRRGPKPMKNWVTFMPVDRAVTKWPVSCRKTDTRMPTRNTNIHTFDTASQANSARMASPAISPARPPPRARAGRSGPTAAAGQRSRLEPVVAAGRGGRRQRHGRWRRPGRIGSVVAWRSLVVNVVSSVGHAALNVGDVLGGEPSRLAVGRDHVVDRRRHA